eukprot:TRINITY_DN3398_c0_g1_i1.p1 TRINITY_DN3398_c0_g1~~TRINITY_DN3398_c0_g1_i1.p1  ORF type:complete len:690 (+),score=155.05 TRINITY_DN3398_c0_g1_i1:118-2187(+)
MTSFQELPERFDQEHYFTQQRELVNQREKKIKALFPSPNHPIHLEWSNLNLQVTTKKWKLLNRKKNKPTTTTKHILSNLSGSVAPGEFLAILGPSGAGKTSLLHALAGRIPLKQGSSQTDGLTGKILVNGVDRSQTPVDQESCFVLQEDIFFGEPTVKQTLRFTARLSMPKDHPTKEKDRRAEDLIELLRLKKCANTCVGSILRRGVSGGEKKRLNIANELMSNATLVLMDEPTSGLDASTALLVVSLLADLARSGKTVIATLHQPSSAMFHMFDKLLLLADGQTAFLGDAKLAVPYFAKLGFECPEQFNPADYLLNILDEVPSSADGGPTYRTAILEAYRRNNRLALKDVEDSDSGDESHSLGEIVKEEKEERDDEVGAQEYSSPRSRSRSSALPPPLPSDLNKGFQASYWSQMWLLALRGAKQHLIEAIPNLIIFLIMSALSSMYWWQLGYSEDDIGNRAGLLFFSIWNSFMLPMFSAITELATERKVVRKERPTHLYRLSAYILSKTIANAPIDALSPIIMSIIIYWTCNLNDKFDRFVIFCILSFFGQLAGMGIGIALGVNFDRPEKATPWVIVVFFVFTITGGFFISISNIPSAFRWTQYISLLKYWTDAALVNEFDDKDHVFKVKDPLPGEAAFITGKEYLRDQDLVFGYKVWPGMLILVGSYIVAQFLAYFLLRWHTQKKRA